MELKNYNDILNIIFFAAIISLFYAISLALSKSYGRFGGFVIIIFLATIVYMVPNFRYVTFFRKKERY